MTADPIMLVPRAETHAIEHVAWDPREAFEEFLAERSPLTAQAYDSDLRALARWMDLGSALEVVEFLFRAPQLHVTQRIKAWKNAMRAANLAPSTRNRRLSAVRALLQCGREAALTTNRAEVRGDKVTARRDTKGPGLEAVVSMLRAAKADPRPKVAARDVALIRCALDLGLRRSEIVGLRIGDVQGDRIRVNRKGMEGETRTSLTLPAATLDAIRAWLAVYPYDRSEDRPLFVGLFSSASGRALHGNGLSAILKRRAKDAGLDPRTIRAHGLRHTSLTQAAKATGFNIEKVRKFAGHQSTDTTQRYIDEAADHAGECANLVADLVTLD